MHRNRIKNFQTDFGHIQMHTHTHKRFVKTKTYSSAKFANKFERNLIRESLIQKFLFSYYLIKKSNPRFEREFKN